MPEHQASSSSPQDSDAARTSDKDTTENKISSAAASPAAEENSKRTYLSLLPPPQLIELILAIDANRETLIFPHDLATAIEALRQRCSRADTPSALASEDSGATRVKTKPAAAASPVSVAPPAAPVPPPPPPSQPSQAVKPPQYTPPAHYYPYTHTPYYPPPPVTRPHSDGYVPPPAMPPQRNPLFTSAPLMRDLNKSLPAHPPPPPPVSSRDDPNAMPSYEEMIVEAIMDVGDGDGTAPKVLFSWMASHYPLQQNFRPSASQALHKALKRGRLEKLGGKYRLNPSWGGGPTTSKRATRRPTANRALSPPTHPSQGLPHPPPHIYSGSIPFEQAYGYPPFMPHHPSLLPSSHASASQAEEENEGAEGEDMDDYEDEGQEGERGKGESGKETPVAGKEEIRRSLVCLAEVLRTLARNGGVG